MVSTFPTSMDDTPPDAWPLLDGMIGLFGFVPNLAIAMAASPAALKGYLTGLQALDGGEGLNPVERHVVMAAASHANHADYGVAVHATIAGKLGADDVLVKSLRLGRSPTDARLSALISFAHALTENRGQVSRAQLDTFHAAGFDGRALVEVAFAVALKHFANTVAQLAAPAIDPGFREPSTAAA